MTFSSIELKSLVALTLFFVQGCSGPPQGGATLNTARLVTIDEFEQFTKNVSQIEYLGPSVEGEPPGLYFHTMEQGYFRIEDIWTSLPPVRAADVGVANPPMYVQVKNGEIVPIEAKK